MGSNDPSFNFFLNGIIVGTTFLSIGFLFKITAAPFHIWAPDVYEGSPTPITAFFAIVPKIAILSIILRLFFNFLHELPESSWQTIFFLCSVSSMILAAFTALYQKKLKRFLVYSSIGHIGYILMGLVTGSFNGFQGVFIYICIYIIMSINLWTILLSLEKRKKGIIYLTDLGGLAYKNPILAFTFIIIIFSMAGIPPLAGFCAKLYVFIAAIESKLYLLAIIGVLTSIIGAFYYIRFVKLIYFEKPKNLELIETISKEKSIILGISFLFTIFFIINPNPLLLLSKLIAFDLGLF